MEVTRYQPQSAELAAPSALPDAAHALVEWAAAAEAAYQLAQKLVVTSFVPDQYRNRPEQGAAAIMAGAEVGLSPIAALRSFDVIGGVSAARALTLRAIAQAQGHEFLVDVATPSRCVIRGRRRGATEWQTVEWTMQRAAALGLTGKKPWREQPQNMLVARATSEVVRLVAADAVLGIAYSSEELADQAVATTTVTRPSGKQTVRRQITPPTEPEVPAPADDDAPAVGTPSGPEPAVEATPEPELDEPAPAAAEPGDDADAGEPMITSPQLKKIAAGMRDLGITDRYDALSYVAQAIGRQVSSRNELTLTEAHQVIESLEFDLQHGPDEPQEQP